MLSPREGNSLVLSCSKKESYDAEKYHSYRNIYCIQSLLCIQYQNKHIGCQKLRQDIRNRRLFFLNDLVGRSSTSS
jgi:hypothetical protein